MAGLLLGSYWYPPHFLGDKLSTFMLREVAVVLLSVSLVLADVNLFPTQVKRLHSVPRKGKA